MLGSRRRVRRRLAVIWHGVSRGRGGRLLCALLALALLAGLFRVIALVVAEDAPAARAQREQAGAGGTVRPGPPPATAATGRPFTGRAPVWPSAASAEVDLSSPKSVRAQGTPVSVTAAGPAAPAKVG